MSEQTLFDNAPCVNSPGEERIIELVRDGTFRIDEDGTIWRLSVLMRNGARRDGPPVQITPRRAESKNYAGYFVIRSVSTKHGVAHAFSHRIIWIIANGPIPPKMQINHKNGNRQDNRLSNLEIVTCQQNIRHAYDVLHRKPPMGARTVLTESDVREIRSLHGVMSYSAIGRKFGTTGGNVFAVIKRLTWRHVQ